MASAVLYHRLAKDVSAMEKPDSSKDYERRARIRYTRDYSFLFDDTSPPKKATGGWGVKAEGSNQSKKAGQKRNLEEEDVTVLKPHAKLAKTEEVEVSPQEGKIGLEPKKPYVVRKGTGVSFAKTEGSSDRLMKSGQISEDLTSAKAKTKEIEKLMQEAAAGTEEKNPEVLIDVPTRSRLRERMAHVPKDKVANLVNYIKEEVNIRTMRMTKSGPAFSAKDVHGNDPVHPWEGYGLTQEEYEKDLEWLKTIYREDQSQEKLMDRWKWGREFWTQYAATHGMMRNRSRALSVKDGRMMEMQAREAIVDLGLLKK